MKYDLVSKRRWFFLVSAIVIFPGLVSLLLPGGLHPGIDFTSGTIFTFRFDDVTAEQSKVREAFADLGHREAIVQRADGGVYIVRTASVDPSVEALGDAPPQSERQRIEDLLSQRFGPLTVLGFDLVSPVVASEIVRSAILAVFAACLGIMVYLAWAFRHVKSPWRYGVCTVVALLHDALAVLGIFSILGRVFGTELGGWCLLSDDGVD